MGGRSGGSRDAIMRNLLAENLDKAATRRTVAAITERNRPTPTPMSRKPTPMQAAPAVQPARRSRAPYARASGDRVGAGQATSSPPQPPRTASQGRARPADQSA